MSAVHGLTIRDCWIEGVVPVTDFGATAIAVNTTFNVPKPTAPGAADRISVEVSIVGNEIELDGATGAYNTIGVLVFSAGVPGAEVDVHVVGNDVSMAPPDGTVFGPASSAISVGGFAEGNRAVSNTLHGSAGHAMAIFTFPAPPAQVGVPANKAFVLNRLDDFVATGADVLVGDQVLGTLVVGQGTVEDHGIGTVIVPSP